MDILTTQERKALVFVTVLALAGLAINFWQQRDARVSKLIRCYSHIGEADLNSANERELLEVPGIGKTLAARIIAYRSGQGPFRRKEELLNIDGLTAYRYQRMKDFVYVE